MESTQDSGLGKGTGAQVVQMCREWIDSSAWISAPWQVRERRPGWNIGSKMAGAMTPALLRRTTEESGDADKRG